MIYIIIFMLSKDATKQRKVGKVTSGPSQFSNFPTFSFRIHATKQPLSKKQFLPKETVEKKGTAISFL